MDSNFIFGNWQNDYLTGNLITLFSGSALIEIIQNF